MTEEIIKEVFNKAFKKHFPEAIIIDGVNISECVYCLNNKLQGKTHAPSKSMPYAKETSCIACKADITKYNFCKHNPNCYYKQLQRLKQDNEKLKEKLIDMQLIDDEIERLKDKADTMEMANDIKKQDIDSLRETNEKLRKALEEIREIANQTNCKNKLTEYTVADLSTMQNKFSEILNKINEVLNNEF